MAGNAEREKELLEAFLGVAAKRMSHKGTDAFSHYRHRFEQMKPCSDTVTALGFVVEARDTYKRGHSQKVSRLAAQIAIQAGLSGAEIEEIRLGGILHDIGKIHVPQHLLDKPTSLTAEEYEIMKSHAAWGEKMLEPAKGKPMERIRRVVRHHHERYDGKGYPDGLAGNKIPLGARIVAVAEAFDNMVSDVPYRRAHTFEDAIAEIRRSSGTQFDPKVVTAFLDLVQINGDPRKQQ